MIVLPVLDVDAVFFHLVYSRNTKRNRDILGIPIKKMGTK